MIHLRCNTQSIAHWPLWRVPLQEDKATSIKTDPHPEGTPGSAGDVTPGTGSRKAIHQPTTALGRCEGTRRGLAPFAPALARVTLRLWGWPVPRSRAQPENGVWTEAGAAPTK